MFYTPIFRLKKIHNIKDYVYKIYFKEENKNLWDLIFYLNSRYRDFFFWEYNGLIHSTGEINWEEILTEFPIEKIEKVWEGYIAPELLPIYTQQALFFTDYNKLLSPNFKVNPIFKKLRKRTKKGWNLSLWQKFVDKLSLNFKYQEVREEGEEIEYQVIRWFETERAENFLILKLLSGIQINLNLAQIGEKFSEEVLKNYFSFRIKGTHRIGKLVNLREKEALIYFEELKNSFFIPLEKLYPIFIPKNLSWKDKDKTELLKHLRILPQTLCRYLELFEEILNQILEPFMIRVENVELSWQPIKTSPYVVLGKERVNYSELLSVFFEKYEVYKKPQKDIKIKVLDLTLKSEKNKKLLRSAKETFLSNLEEIFKNLKLNWVIEEVIYPHKIKVWENYKVVLPSILEFLKHELSPEAFNIVIIPYAEKITEYMERLNVFYQLNKLLKPHKGMLLFDRKIKIFFKTRKEETKKIILFEILNEVFKAFEGQIYVLDEPLPFDMVAIEKEEKYYEIYNLIGELIEITDKFSPSPKDLLITSSTQKFGSNIVNLQKGSFVLKECENLGIGWGADLGHRTSLVTLPSKEDFGLRIFNKIQIPKEQNRDLIKKTIYSLRFFL